MADTTDDHPSGWEGILNPGERILWQGQPDRAPDFSKVNLRRAIPGAVLAGFAVFWITVSLGALEDGPVGLVFPMVGAFVLILALRQIASGVVADVWRRRRTWYSLSNQRAFIATRASGRKSLDAYPITATTKLVHEDRHPGNIWFATDFRKSKRGSDRLRIGFARLPDSNEVHLLMQQVQRGAR